MNIEWTESPCPLCGKMLPHPAGFIPAHVCPLYKPQDEPKEEEHEPGT
jgi:hypothetical protein